MIKHTLIATGMIAIAATAFAAQAQTDMSNTSDTVLNQNFTTLDSDGNGRISWPETEANGISRSAFRSAETTQDDALSNAEYQAAQAARDGIVGEAVEVADNTSGQMEMTAGDSIDTTTGGMSTTTGGTSNTTGDVSETTGDITETTGDVTETAGDADETTPGDAAGVDDGAMDEPGGAEGKIMTDDH